MGSLIGHRWVFFCPIVHPEPCEQCNKVVGFIRVYVDRGLQLCFTAASHNLLTKQHKSDSGKYVVKHKSAKLSCFMLSES